MNVATWLLDCDCNCQDPVLDPALEWWLSTIPRNDSCIDQGCLECPLNNGHGCANKPWHSMTRARICQLPDSEWQPKCHPRRDACFHSFPSWASPREQRVTAGCPPGPTGGDGGWHPGHKWKASPEEDLDGVVKSQWLRNSGEQRAATWAGIPGRDSQTHPKQRRLGEIFP